MKNGLLVWNILLTIIAGYLLFTHFKKGGNRSTTGKVNSADTASFNQQFRIAYFEMDSVATNAELVKEVKSELNKKEEDINNELDRLSKDFQQRLTYYQNLSQGGNLTPEQEQSASQEMETMNGKMKTRKQQLDQEYTDLMTRRQNEIKSKIESFLKEYNEEKKFSYIVSYEQGLFYYKDTLYNITADLVKGLNAQYKPTKK